MKIAIPTMDEQTLSAHFGRSTAFLVFDIENGDIRNREVRPNVHGHQAHGHHEHGQGGPVHGHGHDHGGFISLLHDCSVVLSGGMGAGAWNALRGAGMKVYLVLMNSVACSWRASSGRMRKVSAIPTPTPDPPWTYEPLFRPPLTMVESMATTCVVGGNGLVEFDSASHDLPASETLACFS